MPENQHKVKLETLLKFKKLEQPSAQDWTRFDRELKEKMLHKSLIKKNVFSLEYLYKAFRFSIPRILPVSVAALFVFAIWLGHDEVSFDTPVNDIFAEVKFPQLSHFVTDELGIKSVDGDYSKDFVSNDLYASTSSLNSYTLEYTVSANPSFKPSSETIVY